MRINYCAAWVRNSSARINSCASLISSFFLQVMPGMKKWYPARVCLQRRIFTIDSCLSQLNSAFSRKKHQVLDRVLDSLNTNHKSCKCLSVRCIFSPKNGSKMNYFRNVYDLIISLLNKNWKLCKNLILRVLITAQPTYAQNFSY